ncbi:MAG: F0F1 ATP synthase subunit A [Armatimonadetes bacterium]|nr:F0F1 ATP synthase subunit A [Armatimonadota bacterium]
MEHSEHFHDLAQIGNIKFLEDTLHHYVVARTGSLDWHVDTILYSTVIVLVLGVTSFLIGGRFREIPGSWSLQNVFEMVVAYLKELSESIIGHDGPKYVPFAATTFLFILISNYMGLFPMLKPPTRDYNTTLALALISFVAFNYFGIRKKGVGKWLAHFIDPVPSIWASLEGGMKLLVLFLGPLFLFLNIIEEVARIVSLSIRLFGNIMGEHTVMATLLGLVITVSYVFDFIPLFVWLLGLLAGAIQALIFAILTLSYIGGAVGEHH